MRTKGEGDWNQCRWKKGIYFLWTNTIKFYHKTNPVVDRKKRTKYCNNLKKSRLAFYTPNVVDYLHFKWKIRLQKLSILNLRNILVTSKLKAQQSKPKKEMLFCTRYEICTSERATIRGVSPSDLMQFTSAPPAINFSIISLLALMTNDFQCFCSCSRCSHLLPDKVWGRKQSRKRSRQTSLSIIS